MHFIETDIAGAWIVEAERIEDERGFFARTWSVRELTERGLDAQLAQCSVSFNRRSGTLRGMHFQVPPHEETKLVRCTAGRIFDVIVDLRRASPTFRRWVGVELSAENRRALYIPKGCAHGFQTLADGCEVFYQISAEYAPQSARGVRYDDAAFGITWPLPVSVIAARDRAYKDFEP